MSAKRQHSHADSQEQKLAFVFGLKYLNQRKKEFILIGRRIHLCFLFFLSESEYFINPQGEIVGIGLQLINNPSCGVFTCVSPIVPSLRCCSTICLPSGPASLPDVLHSSGLHHWPQHHPPKAGEPLLQVHHVRLFFSEKRWQKIREGSY